MEVNLIQEAEEPISSEYVNKPVRQIRRRSDVWDFMEYRVSKTNRMKYIECKLCGLHLTASSRSGTSNLRNHLLNRHADQYHPDTIPDRHRLKHGHIQKFAEGPFSSSDSQSKVKDEEGGKVSETKPGEASEMVVDGGADTSTTTNAANGTNANGADAMDAITKTRNIAFSQAAKNKALIRLQQSKMKSAMHSNLKKLGCSKFRAQGINNAIFQMLINDLLPVNVIEGVGFRGLIEAFQGGYTFPTVFSIEERLLARLGVGRTKLSERLSSALKIGLTCDLWTDYYNRNFITVTSHVISAEWKNESWVLGTVKVKANATDVDVAQQISEVCQSCGVTISDVPAMVYGTDGKQSVADTSERLKVLKSICAFLNVESRPCAGELLGIAVQNALGIPSITKLIQDAGQLITHLSTDRICQRRLRDALKNKKSSLTLTICDNSSGWQVISDMFCQLAELQDVIGQVLGVDLEVNLTESQWKVLHEIIHALQGVKAAVAVMGDDKNKSGSCWLPVMHGVLQHIDVPNAEDISEDGQVFRNILSAELKARCELNEILPSSLMMQAAAIDPRFHHLRFLSDEDRVPVIEGLKEKLADNHREDQHEHAEDEKDSPFFALLGEDEFNKKITKPEDEIDLFRLERPVSRETDALNWWRLNEKRFPGLSKLAKGILCVPIAATPLCMSAETMRSLENRKRLDHMHIDAQLFLHKNTELFD
ncbi:zinc finger BED domain-containing protein 4-like [Lytechinus variegatus]|uniref:zinc finger BED domain-containing protein 4-like n=1 Tax=Lytechinus variegatus TaxID=7654 RepID=UPI001BB1A3FD|nr:zinc finger BED domain-containing protein 4-like [Lytechinus variegatus]